MKSKILAYAFLLVAIVLLIITSYFYRYQGVIYRIQRYNFKIVQENLLKFTDEDFIILDSIRIARNI